MSPLNPWNRGAQAQEKVIVIQEKLKKLSPENTGELIELVLDLTEALNETLEELHEVDKVAGMGGY